ncbi:hypothetical protein [Dryocola clanedunensis]|uniref:hypothetical protein n=1 Tax=Cedecea sulfonylureivorans TaxID=3051154 RepID=UPI001925B6DD|nr:hypothetical protein [Cedecea sulfonylureivorans]
MAINNSTTLARPEITADQSIIAQNLRALLKLPLGTEHYLFQALVFWGGTFYCAGGWYFN